MLASAGEEASVLAGGQSLVPLMNFRLAQPRTSSTSTTSTSSTTSASTTAGWRSGRGRGRRPSSAPRRSRAPRRSSPRRWARSPIRRCATAARSSGASSTPTRPPSSPRSSSRSTARSCSAGPTASAASRRASSSPARYDGQAPGRARHRGARPRRGGGDGHAIVEFSRRHADFAVAGASVSGGAIALFGVADTPVRATEAERLLAADAGRERRRRRRPRRPTGSSPTRTSTAAALPPPRRPRLRRTGARACTGRCVMRIATTVNGIRYERDVEPRRCSSTCLREDLGLVRHAHRLRARRLRDVHRAHERRDDALLPDVRGPGRRRGDHDRRGAGQRRECTRSRRRSGRSRACSAASARRAC